MFAEEDRSRRQGRKAREGSGFSEQRNLRRDLQRSLRGLSEVSSEVTEDGGFCSIFLKRSVIKSFCFIGFVVTAPTASTIS